MFVGICVYLKSFFVKVIEFYGVFMLYCAYLCMYVDFVLIWVQFARKLRNICRLVWWVGFLANCTKLEVFPCKFENFAKCQS